MVKRKIDEVDAFLKDFESLKDRESRTCYVKGCKKSSHGFGIKGGLGWGFRGGDRVSCKKHRLPEHVEQNHFCIYLGCDVRAKLAIGDHNLCAEHVEEIKTKANFPEEFVTRTKTALCQHEGCTVAASYDKTTHCKVHANSASSDDKRVCDIKGCGKKRPTFGYPGKPRTRCAAHKESGMFSRKLCITDGCKISASYGNCEGVVVHCKKHMVPGETLINNKKCQHAECDKQPSFGDPVSKVKSHCKTHAPEGFVDVLNKRCTAENCEKLCIDSTRFCVSHGGGKKCTLPCCMFGGPRPQYGNPDDGSRICAFGARALMEDALLNNDIERARMLQTHFKRKTMMVLNQQSAFRTELEKKYWKLLDTCHKIYFDETVSEKPKTTEDLRPDIFYLWKVDGTKMAIHIEYDEGKTHEDDDLRLKYIADTSGTTGNVYVIRVNATTNASKNALCTRRQMGSVVYFEVNEVGRKVASKVADAVIERIQWIEEGLGPDDSRPAKVYFG